MFHSEPKLWSKFPETKGARKTRFSSRTPNLISCQRIFALIHLFHVHCREVANGSLIVYALTYWSIKSTIFHSWEEPLHHKADQMGLFTRLWNNKILCPSNVCTIHLSQTTNTGWCHGILLYTAYISDSYDFYFVP